MFVPVGLLSRLLSGASDAHDAGQQAAMAAAGVEADLARAQMASHQTALELQGACTGTSGCLVFLGETTWTDLAFDQTRVDPNVAPAPQGFYAVCPGRHTLRVTAGPRTLARSLLVYPGEAFLLRLDATAGDWALIDGSDAKAVLDRVASGVVPLLNYYQAIGAVRVRSGRLVSSTETVPHVVALVKEAVTAIVSNDQGRAVQLVQRAATMLDGVPLLSTGPLTSLVGFHAFDLLGRGQPEVAWLVAQAGLALLPDDSTLLAVLGEICLRAGKGDEARAHLARALARETGLDETWRARVRELLAASSGGAPSRAG